MPTLRSPSPRRQCKGVEVKSVADDITFAEHFADLAKRFRAMASSETGSIKAEWERLANCYTEISNGSDQNQLSEAAGRPDKL
jgi:hypothetical protein